MSFIGRRIAVASVAIGLLALGAGEVSAQAAADAPAPSAAIAGRPTVLGVVGDSITQATGTGALAAENPKNSWATGWEVDSVAAQLGIATNNRYNLAANGNRMTHFVSEVRDGKSGGSGDVAPLPANTGLVLVEFGGNDLCRDSVNDMTSVTDYRNQFKAGLTQVTSQAPTALIQVMSVPDIYNLWYIRGAPQDPLHHPESESNQAGGINGARTYWGLGVIPCQSLLSNPASYNEADRNRRLAVRTRTKEYNQVLAQECAKVLRCKFDDNRLFDLTSNRQTPPDGPLWPQPYWNFTDLDISRNSTSGCPIPGLFSGGCGDHFHPSKQGQGKIATTAMAAGRDWSETTYPLAGGSVRPSTRPSGLHHGRATVRFTGSDAAGLRGQEVRVHNPDGSTTPWTQHLGVAPDRTVDKVGRSYVEVRSLDVNGNLSAGSLITVDVVAPLTPGAPGSPTISANASATQVAWTAPADDGGGSITRYDVSTLAGTPPTATGSPVAVPGLSATVPAPPAGAVVRYQVTATNATGASAPSAPSSSTVAPFASMAAFVDRQYRDFMGRPPTGAELFLSVARLDAGTETPTAFVDRLRASDWFDGAYGPAIRLYQAYFLRLPDPSGLDYWAARRREGRTLAKMSRQFSASPEFVQRYGELTDVEFIDEIYNNVFNRDPDPGGRDYYLARLSRDWNRGHVVLQFSESPEYRQQMRPVVDSIELARGMGGRAPSQLELEYLLLDYTNGGAERVFQTLIAKTTYRTRVFS